MNPRHEPLVVKRVTRRLIPFAFLCYVVAYIDRVNIGFAATRCSATWASVMPPMGLAPVSSFSAIACSRSRAT